MNTADMIFAYLGWAFAVSLGVLGYLLRRAWLKFRENYVAEQREHDEAIERIWKENNTLRALLPKLEAPCAYCGDSDISKCKLGFPGCSQADDMLVGDCETMRRLLCGNRSAERVVVDARECLRNCLMNSPFDPFERGEAIRSTIGKMDAWLKETSGERRAQG